MMTMKRIQLLTLLLVMFFKGNTQDHLQDYIYFEIDDYKLSDMVEKILNNLITFFTECTPNSVKLAGIPILREVNWDGKLLKKQA